jgi:hypothetical protein
MGIYKVVYGSSFSLYQTFQILWVTAITRGHNNIESPINTVVKVIQMEDKLFNWVNKYQIG